jgi:hypothetical protein
MRKVILPAVLALALAATSALGATSRKVEHQAKPSKPAASATNTSAQTAAKSTMTHRRRKRHHRKAAHKAMSNAPTKKG